MRILLLHDNYLLKPFAFSDFLARVRGLIRWGGSLSQVDVHTRRLRSKVDDPFPVKLIHTVRGMGYVLEER